MRRLTGPGECERPDSGAEANEDAIKMAYEDHDGRRGTILRNISLHGRTLGAGSPRGRS
ncbi:hypothetical protein [Micromonospora sp. NPDC048830]|uniref:hypothetical protein n=1 Tax=Micromonospora sp. NPDC048830 TaxID=3364257 RepID=UPI00371EAD9E